MHNTILYAYNFKHGLNESGLRYVNSKDLFLWPQIIQSVPNFQYVFINGFRKSIHNNFESTPSSFLILISQKFFPSPIYSTKVQIMQHALLLNSADSFGDATDPSRCSNHGAKIFCITIPSCARCAFPNDT